FLWRPLSVWAEKFRYEFAVSTTSPEGSRILDWVRDQAFLTRLNRALSRGVDAIFSRIDRLFRPEPGRPQGPGVSWWAWVKRAALGLLLFAVGYGAWQAVSVLIATLRKPWPVQAVQIPAAILVSGLRLTIAYFISLAWTLPVAIWVGERERLS